MKDKSRIVVHILPDEKFTSGYIGFMLGRVKSVEHKFMILCSDAQGAKFEIPKKYSNYTSIICTKAKATKMQQEDLAESNKIIVSGIFGGVELWLLRNGGMKLLKKSYLQFWGGDFYSYRETEPFSKKWFRKKRLHFCIGKCAGIINLVPGDYDELSKIFPNKTPHYVASMPGGAVEDWAKFSSKKHEGPKKVLLGNSATQENQHIEAINILSRFKDQNIEVVCPLSYGDKEYAKRIAEFGKKKLGRSFYPILDFMERDKYFSLLSECEVGIFNNNRQQAMGNINSLIELGKKVFLNVNTSMWKDYTSFGIKIYNIEDIKQMNWQDFWEMPEYVKKNNRKQLRIRNEQYDSNWSIILNI